MHVSVCDKSDVDLAQLKTIANLCLEIPAIEPTNCQRKLFGKLGQQTLRYFTPQPTTSMINALH